MLNAKCKVNEHFFISLTQKQFCTMHFAFVFIPKNKNNFAFCILHLLCILHYALCICFHPPKGVPYDPLAKADPNTTLSVEEREIGGLGIFMVKKTMDEITYEYKDGQNILKIKKNL